MHKSTDIIYANHPFDLIGWDGSFYPWIFNINDFEPIVGSIHQPPPVHQRFEGVGFVICSFVTRLFDFHKDAIPAPYPHSNVDSEEVIFYSNINNLSDKIQKFAKDDFQRKKIAKEGKKKYMKYFNSTLVADYIVKNTFNIPYKKSAFMWENK